METHASHVHKNEAHVSGVLARDVEFRYTASGKAVANINVATKYKDSTEYHRVTCWEQLAEKVQPLKTGEFVQIVGRLQTRSWEDKQNGAKEILDRHCCVAGRRPWQRHGHNEHSWGGG
jgi:single stranded DNA-binding protein